ncbi:non-ribosomal peptide synthetase/type I polyketide synthase [Gulosibacter hominis]|uniref:non-ribosomal peptide synthetase/type I polyketide synthase n=1 Tax=Gulosibacter hominis TaxID=2770504 RepID=UPI001918898F|nr:non-ribosomal peptide synthetase/type I polyketide synthase [Gulosibacter hominis]
MGKRDEALPLITAPNTTQELVPLTASQQGMYFECLLRKSPDFAVTFEVSIDPVSEERVRDAVARIIAEQPALRASIAPQRDGVFYRIAEHLDPPLEVHDLRDAADGTARADEISRASVEAPFDLETGPLLRVVLMRLTEADRLVIVCHHLVADGQSLGILAARLVELIHGSESALDTGAPVKPDAGFVAYQLRRGRELPEKPRKRREAYWREHLSAQETPDLTHWMRPAATDAAAAAGELGYELRLPIEPELHGQLRELAMSAEVSEHTVYLAAFGLLLSHYTGAESVSVTMPFTDRPGLEEAESVGCFLTTLPVRLEAARELTVAEMLASVSREVMGGWRNLGYPVAGLLSEYPALAGVHDITFIQDTFAELPAGVQQLHRSARVPFPGRLTVLVEHFADRAQLVFQYKADALTEAEARRFGTRYLELLAQLPDALDAAVRELRVIPDAEAAQLRGELADTHYFDWEPDNLGKIFLERTSADPATIAWRDVKRTYSNAWAHDAAARIQRRLLAVTDGERVPVAIQLPRSAELLASVFGVLLAGAHYVPLAVETPAQRLQQIADDSDLKVILATSDISIELPAGVTRLNIDTWPEIVALREDEHTEIADAPVDIALSADDLLYIEYTSGSTGLPKGVMIRHRNIQNTALDLERRFPLKSGDRYLLKTSFTFDIFGTEIYGWLFGAGELFMLPTGEEADPFAVISAIRDARITHLNSSPTMLRVLLDAVKQSGSETDIASLRYIFSGGEALTPDIMQRFFALELPCSLENVYGPTEASMWATHGTIEKADTYSIAPIGKALNDYRIYVVGDNNTMLGPGLPGEVCITGAGVAVGYLNRDELNARQFIENPFFDAAVDPEHQSRMYRTGDLGYLREDGKFAFLRRIDRQVKVGGVRIELGEVEHALHEVDGVIEAAVVVDESTGTARLAAFFTAHNALPVPELRRQLGRTLMPNQIPAILVQVDALPTSAAGKLDRRALLARLAAGDNAAGDTAAANPLPAPMTEPADETASYSVVTALRTLWQEVLGTDLNSLSAADTSFFDLGGNSLNLMRLQLAIRDELAVELPITELMRVPTLARQAELIAAALSETAVAAAPARAAADSTTATTNSDAAQIGHPADIAIIGIGIQTPGASDVHEFWQRLRHGDETIKFYSDEELRDLGISEHELRDPSYVKANGRLEGADSFDSTLFRIPPAEVEATSPQLRLLYECYWQACEDAGYDPTQLSGRVGVFVGGNDDFEWYRQALLENDSFGDTYENFTLATNHFLATRLSYRFGLTGPAYSALAACSTSLLTVHLAVQSLRLGECEVAVAGGVTLESPNDGGYQYVDGMMLSPDGHCRPFDSEAAGTVFSNAGALLLLKPLAAAQRDGDPIVAVIKGSAVGNDGRRKLSFTAPSEDGQAETIRAAYESSSIDPKTVSFVEAHGTGTLLGDPIEVASLTRVFEDAEPQSIALGSVKGNLGHTDSAAGAVGLAKAALALKHRYLPGTRNYANPNPNIEFANTPFDVSAQGRSLPGEHIRAGINSFGVGGTNVHMILESAPADDNFASTASAHTVSDPASAPYQLLQFAAASAAAVTATADRVVRHLATTSTIGIDDAARTLREGRGAQPHRIPLVIASDEHRDAQAWADRIAAARVTHAQQGGRTALLFSGQGNQHHAMGRGLYRSRSEAGRVFRQSFDEIVGFLPAADADTFRTIVHGQKEDPRINRTEWSQYALFATQYAMAKTLESFGVYPDVLLGHSIGELTAAALAGVWGLEDAARLVRERGLLMQNQQPGIMMAVTAPAERIAEVITDLDEVWVSLDNSAQRSVLGMSSAAFDVVCDRLEAADIRGTRLHTQQAFHTPMMAAAGEDFERAVAGVITHDPRIPIISNRSGRLVEPGEMTDPQYWHEHITGRVNFAASLRTLFSDDLLGGKPLYGIELGPGHSLSTFAAHEPTRGNHHTFVNVLRHPVEDTEDEAHLLGALGTLWAAGADLDFSAHTTGQRTSLPGTSFDKQPVRKLTAQQPRQASAAAARTTSPALHAEPTSTPPAAQPSTTPAENSVDAVCEAFREVLGYPQIAPQDDFFVLGGDSLKATVLVGRLNSVLAGQISVADVFAASTPAALAAKFPLGKTGTAAPVTAAAVGLERVADAADYPLSAAQVRMYLAAQLEPDSLVYNMPSATRFEGVLDHDRIRDALTRLVERHEPLRTVVVRRADEVRQRILAADEIELPLAFMRVSGDAEERIEELVADFVRPFDLARGPLFRTRFITDEHGASILLFDIHHLVADAVSVEVLTRDFGLLYDGEPAPLPVQYRDWCAHLAAPEVRAEEAAATAALVSTLRDAPLGDLLPTDRPRTANFSGADRVSLHLDPARTAALVATADEHRATAFMVVLAAWGAVLGRYSGREDLLIGVPVTGRTHADTAEMVGMFVNMMPVRLHPELDSTVANYLESTRDTVLTALDHQQVPFERVVSELNVPRALGRHPLVDVSVDYHNVEHHDFAIDGIATRPIELAPRGAGMDLVVTCLESDAGLTIDLDYASELFERSAIERLAEHFEALLARLTDQDTAETPLNELPVGHLPLIDDRHRARIAARIESAPFVPIHSLIAERARLTPEAIAVIDADGSEISIGELDALANAQAARLVAAGLRRGDQVALFAERDATLLIAQLAILKAGGAYVPIDPRHPRERHEHILADVAPRFGFAAAGVAAAQRIPVLFDLADCRNEMRADFVGPDIASGDTAYVVYTSGSTGKPKGIAVPHGGIANLQRDHARRGLFAADDTIIALADPTFDIFVFESLLPLATSARVHMCPTSDYKDAAAIARRIRTYDVTMIQGPVSKIAAFCGNPRFRDVLPQLRTIVCGGEHFADNLLELLQNTTSARIFNMYGPSETTVTATVKEFSPGDSITIGAPIDGAEVLIVGEHGGLEPHGVPGELVIVGAGLANGYTNNPEQQAHAFIELRELPGVRAYRTGDGGLRRADGEVELRGRLDHQVKHHGNRIELGEIEQAALSVAGIEYAVADVVRDDLVLCCTTADRDSVATPLAEALAAALPDYMIPTRTVWLDDLPTLPNGKIDRRALRTLLEQRGLSGQGPAEPHRDASAAKGAQGVSIPSDADRKSATALDYERTLAAIVDAWNDVLERQVRPDDNFFEVGGNSYKLMLVNNRLAETLDRDIPLVQLFEHPTPAALAKSLAPTTVSPAVDPALVADTTDGAVPHSGSPEGGLSLHDLTGLGDWDAQWAAPEREPLAEAADRRIAVIGMAGVFPGADDVDEHLQNRFNGVVSIDRASREQLRDAGIDEATIDRHHYVNARGYVAGDTFDADFFGYSAREAESMDPQIRLLHETAWHALEHGGYSPADFDGRIGLFAGSSTNFAWMAGMLSQERDAVGVFEALTANEKDFLATRIAYKLDLKGPAVTVQTACSTSLVAIHEAVACLRRGEADMALAGGVSLNFPRREGYQWHEGMIFSEDGVCRPFSADANGTVPGQGCGVVLLKPLAQAIADGDTIHAVIAGTAMNNDGREKVGYSAPSVGGQERVIRAAVADAGVDPAEIGYVETHGTGTHLGDPVEAAALAAVYGGGPDGTALGAVKANIGHLDAAAGVAGFIGAVGALRSGTVPPMANFTALNEQLHVYGALRVPTEQLKPVGGLRAAAVSSFGIGGTNVHMVLEAAPVNSDSTSTAAIDEDCEYLLPLSARTRDSLAVMRQQLETHLVGANELLADASYTLARGRAEFAERSVAIAAPGLPLQWLDTDSAPLALLAGDGTRLVLAAELVAETDTDNRADSSKDTDAAAGVEGELCRAFAAELEPFDTQLRRALRVAVSGGAVPGGATNAAVERIAQYAIRAALIRVVGESCLRAATGDDRLLRIALGRVRGELDAPATLRALRSGHLPTGVGQSDAAIAPAVPIAAGTIDADALRRLLASRWVHGADVSRAAFCARGCRVPLPGYAFEQRQFTADVRFDHILPGSVANPAQSGAEQAAPTGASVNDVDAALREAWQEVLGSEPHADADFLLSGGDSLSAVHLTSRLETIAGIHLSVAEIFADSRFSAIAALLSDKTPTAVPAAPSVASSKDPGSRTVVASPAQRRMYAVCALQPGTTAYNLALTYRVTGALDVDRLRAAFATLVDRHEQLRCGFELDSGELLQRIYKQAPDVVSVIELDEAAAEAYVKAEPEPFDLAGPSLLRVEVLRVNESLHYLRLDLHHIVGDQHSLAVLADELVTLLEGFDVTALGPLPTAYTDYAQSVHEREHTGGFDADVAYFLDRIGSDAPQLELPTDFAAPDEATFAGARHKLDCRVDAEALTTVARSNGATPFAVLMAAVTRVLSVWSGQREFIIGTAVSGRTPALARTIGMFVNTLPLRVDADSAGTGQEAIIEARDNVLATLAHQHAPFESVLAALELPVGGDSNPLFDVLVNYVNVGTDELALAGTQFDLVEPAELNSRYALSFSFAEHEHQLTVDLEYRTELFDASTIERLAGHLDELLVDLVARPQARLAELRLEAEPEADGRMAALTATGPRINAPLIDRLRDSFATHASEPALRWRGEEWSYAELDHRTDRIAGGLQALGVGVGDFVLVLLERGPEQVLSRLALSKCGAVEIPLDPQAPAERIAETLRDSGAAFVLVSDGIDHEWPAGVRAIRPVDLDGEHEPPTEIEADSPLIMIYTSGTTGRPKGTLVTHGGMLSTCTDNGYTDYRPGMRIAHLTGNTFDPSLLDIYSALLAGATLVMGDQEMNRDMRRMGEFLRDERIDAGVIITAVFHLLMAEDPEAIAGMSAVYVGGEAMQPWAAQRAFEVFGPGRLYNLYGPTEASCTTTFFRIDELPEYDRMPIGQPAHNRTLRIVHADGTDVPRGVPGELFVVGPSVALGYHRRPELTAERFITMPNGERGYRTGDLVVLDDDDRIVYLRRIDRQVKHAGHRIELAEIEVVLKSIAGLTDAAVVHTVHGSNSRLTAFYSGTHAPAPAQLRTELGARLPRHMVPQALEHVSSLPLTRHGKIDRARLAARVEAEAEQQSSSVPQPAAPVQAAATATDAHPLVSRILAALRGALGDDSITADDDFFRAGAQSIQAIAAVQQLRAEGIELQVSDIYRAPSAAALAATLGVAVTATAPAQPGRSRRHLTDQQLTHLVSRAVDESASVARTLAGGKPDYSFRFGATADLHRSSGADTGGLLHRMRANDPEHLLDALTQLVQRHESLRGRIRGDQFEVLAADEFESLPAMLTPLDLRRVAAEQVEECVARIAHELQVEPFTDSLLWRCALLRDGDDSYWVVGAFHHAVFDAFSAGIIREELRRLLAGEQLPAAQPFSEFLEHLGVAENWDEELANFDYRSWLDNNGALTTHFRSGEGTLQQRLSTPLAGDDPFAVGLELVRTELAAAAKLDGDIAVGIVNDCRRWRGRDYSASIGEFLDAVPMLLRGDGGDREQVSERLASARERGLHYIHSLSLPDSGDDPVDPLVSELRDAYGIDGGQLGLVLVNFQGYIAPNEMPSDRRDNDADADNAQIALVQVNVWYDDEAVHLEFLAGSPSTTRAATTTEGIR